MKRILPAGKGAARALKANPPARSIRPTLTLPAGVTFGSMDLAAILLAAASERSPGPCQVGRTRTAARQVRPRTPNRVSPRVN
jgi:hypothetical protein